MTVTNGIYAAQLTDISIISGSVLDNDTGTSAVTQIDGTDLPAYGCAVFWQTSLVARPSPTMHRSPTRSV